FESVSHHPHLHSFPTRRSSDLIFEQFKDTFTNTLADIKVDDGLKEGTDMGPLAHERRLTSMQQFVDDATQKGAKVLLGGENTSRSEEHTSELQSRFDLVCRLLL